MFLLEKRYSISDVEKLTNIKRHSLVYYDKEGVFSPSLSKKNRKKWTRRKYSVLDVLVLQAVSDLKERGLSFNRIRKVIEYLRETHELENPFHVALDGRHNVRILTNGDSFYFCFNDSEVIEYLKKGGQYMLLDISDVAFDLKERIKALQLYKRRKEAAKFRQLNILDAKIS